MTLSPPEGQRVPDDAERAEQQAPGPTAIASSAEVAPSAGLDPTVKALGIVTLLNDLSSEVAVRTLPLFLANVLGVQTGIIGLIEGLAESAATLLKIVSGFLADRIGKKKALALWGYGLSGFTKPLLFFAASWLLVLVVRILDRIGKGIRAAPRDALIADVTAPEQRGRAFGFNKAMDKAGAVAGLVLAAAILYFGGMRQVALTRETYRALVLLSVIPGVAAVFVLARWVRERPAPSGGSRSTLRLAWTGLDGRFKAYLAVLVVFTLGNSSDAFLMLRAQTLGLSLVEVFLVLAAFSLVISLSSTPAGALSDWLGRRGLILPGWAIYAVIYFGFAFASSAWHIWALYIGYGLYYGAFQGAASALVADLVPAELRGTAYGLFNAATGVAALPASVLAGLLWDWYGAPAPFLAGGALALVAAVGMVAIIPRSSR
jgi:MFS family permease